MLFHTVVIMVKLPSTYVCYTSVSFTVVITQGVKRSSALAAYPHLWITFSLGVKSCH